MTETVAALAPEVLVGRTRYCIHPDPLVAGVPTVGGTKNPDIEAIAALQPDLILAEKEENRREDVEALAAIAPVFVCDVHTVTEALSMIRQLGSLLDGAQARAEAWTQRITAGWADLPRWPGRPRVLYLIWRKPWMAAGGDCYIHSVLEELGMVNVLADQPRYPTLDATQMAALRPDHVFLSSEPYPFRERHRREVQCLLPAARVDCVDGEAFSWYGVRMEPALAHLRQLVAAA